MRRYVQDEDDILSEKINTGLVLVLGITSLITVLYSVVYSVALVIHKQQSLMESSTTLIVSALLSIIGLGSMHLFQRRLRDAARKKNPWEL
jgi:membrane protein YdbS with pleckstrin-like domain